MKNNLKNLGQNYLRPKKIFAITLFVIILIVVAIPAFFLSGRPKIILTSPDDSQILRLNQNIEITFNKPLDQLALNLSISPKIEGEWEFSDKIIAGKLARKVVFKPSEFYQPDQKYVITIRNIRGIFEKSSNGMKGQNQSVTFRTQKIPDVKGTSLDIDSAESRVCDTIIMTLDQPNDQLAEFDFKIVPESHLKKTIATDKLSYTFVPEPCLIQGQDYTFSIERTVLVPNLDITNKTITVYQTRFRTMLSSGIADFSPKGFSVSTDSKEIRVVFSKPMQQEELLRNISIRPALQGSWSWQNDTTLIFTISSQLEYNTDYFIEIVKGVHNQLNEIIEENVSLSFKTASK